MEIRTGVLVILIAALACERGPQDETLHIEHGGVSRTAYVHYPPDHDMQAPTPVVLNFHGLTSNAQQQEGYAHMNGAAENRGFVAVHPEGLWNSWNAGECCGTAKESGVDDVGFVDALLDELARRFVVDTRRVFATGMSNGGFMSYRLGCERAGRIAAIAPVAAVNGMETCEPSRPVPLLHVHGTRDMLVPYEGGGRQGFVGARESVWRWPGRMGCASGLRETFRQGDARCETADACTGGVEAVFCTIDEGGHTWPGAEFFPGLGRVSRDLNATERALDFFEAHPMP